MSQNESCICKTNDIAQEICFVNNYFLEIKHTFIECSVTRMLSTHLNNLKDSLQHYRHLYELCQENPLNEKQIQEIMNQCAYINEHLTRMAVDICVELLQYRLGELSDVIDIYSILVNKHPSYGKIKNAHEILYIMVPLLHEGKNVLYDFRRFKLEDNRIFSSDDVSEFADTFTALILRMYAFINKIIDLIKKECYSDIVMMFSSRQ